MSRRVIIDCDPGVDDSIALFTALGSPEDIDLMAVCVVAGNVPVTTCTHNARSLLALAGRSEIPVYEGCDRPLIVEPEFADHIHGETGLGDAVLAEPTVPAQNLGAVDYLIGTLEAAAPASITMVITGPMTNFATALQRNPAIATAVKELVIMGGASAAGGNITPHAEFNIYADPDAARIVLACGRPVTLIGLDATLQFRCTPARMERLGASSHRILKAATAMIGHVNKIYGEIYGDEGSALHDPCTIGYLIAPDLFEAQEVAVTVQTYTGETRGQTVVKPSPGSDFRWVTGLRAGTLFDLLIERMERL
ncbi:nucleoside hydrolase [Hyphobacterium sp. HN65]|uniref:Nucleoside hydrolase n=1 Tax=Hyphobacterium lacteum TaxID=3116575 RepID=A0ABU7LSC1_9PROT|nr:nucleoside hydrolase [Hyphobacterium sp. HN65]MEE2526793.1 nucleoside hydrolase [Hyphobacterium sp. HN65]